MPTVHHLLGPGWDLNKKLSCFKAGFHRLDNFLFDMFFLLGSSRAEEKWFRNEFLFPELRPVQPV